MYSEKIIYSRNKISQLTKGLNGSRCGWICRKLRQIADFVSNIPIIGDSLASKITLIADVVSAAEDIFSGRGTVDYEPTPSEALILDQWQQNKLQPYYRKLTNDLSSAFQQTNLQNQVEIINKVLGSMCVIKGYFLNNETTGLSYMATQLRSELIDNIFAPLYGIIGDSLDNYNIETIETTAILNNSTITMFNPLITGYKDLSFDCLNYRLENITQNPTTISPAPLVTSTQNNTQTVVKKSDNTLLWLGVVVAGVIAITIFHDDKEKAKK